MSEEETQDIKAKYDTKPTIETVLERISALGQEMRAGFEAVGQRFDALDVRLDRMEAAAHDTQSKFHYLRADFNELKIELHEYLPVAK